ncbi:hypothetical protein OCGS_0953 [Oceaniovalibus guishaninsula JLT2003]|uniref:Dienelactone hydrolase n=1 Tax=Oceaniovalibus guishaninsula JLT2003 TaxID=1231392 RepID=K2HBP6_9RHOB|nr:dienelactone hydrolase [Oceaniovalibus guishaninsula]EKE44918.1 hypothetical protein OCGS_0953 [Oceaniovalibus guishaninsula JLT2003]
MKPLAAAALALMVALPVMAENRIDRIRPDAPALAPYGDHPVGVRQMTFTRQDAIDVVNATEGNLPTHDRAITVEVWYPAAEDATPGTTYTAFLRDGVTEIELTGRAARDAAPAADGPFPLVVVSHGYPGNRFLMSPLAENLASKGYVVASIDHPDSTYDDLGAFGSTLYHRPLDQAFVLDEMATLDGDLGAVIDGGNAAVIGYSMGGYGALIFAGGGIDTAPLSQAFAPPGRILSRHQAGSDAHAALPDPRVKAVIAIGPWGRNRDFWSEQGLSRIDVPVLLMAGGVDDVSRYDAIRKIFAEMTGTTRHLLTFDDANHNAAAPMPAPDEAWQIQPGADKATFDHYADPVWDSVRMNNIAQHFATAFLDLHLKGMDDRQDYLTLTEDAGGGLWSMAEDGTPEDDHTYWQGFQNRSAAGLRFETLSSAH